MSSVDVMHLYSVGLTDEIAEQVLRLPVEGTSYRINLGADEFAKAYGSDATVAPVHQPNFHTLPRPVDTNTVGDISSLTYRDLLPNKTPVSNDYKTAVEQNIQYVFSKWVRQYLSGGMQTGDDGMSPIFLDMNAHDVGRQRGWDGVTFAKDDTPDSRAQLPGILNMAFIKLIASDKHRGLSGRAIPAGVIPVRLLEQSLDQGFPTTINLIGLQEELVNKMLLQHPVLRHDRQLKDAIFAYAIPFDDQINFGMVRAMLNETDVNERVLSRVLEGAVILDKSSSSSSTGGESNIKQARHSDMARFANAAPLDRSPFSPMLLSTNAPNFSTTGACAADVAQQASTIGKKLEVISEHAPKGEDVVRFVAKAVSVYKYNDGLYVVVPIIVGSFFIPLVGATRGITQGSQTVTMIVECYRRAFMLWHNEAERGRKFGIKTKGIAPRIVAMTVNRADIITNGETQYAAAGWVAAIQESVRNAGNPNPTQLTHADFATWLSPNITQSRLVVSDAPNANVPYTRNKLNTDARASSAKPTFTTAPGQIFETKLEPQPRARSNSSVSSPPANTGTTFRQAEPVKSEFNAARSTSNGRSARQSSSDGFRFDGAPNVAPVDLDRVANNLTGAN